MVRYIKVDTACFVSVDLIVDGELVLPDDGLVSVTVYDTDGEGITGHISQPATVPDGRTYAYYEVPSEVNSLGTDEVGYRFVEFSFAYNERQYTVTEPYELVTRTLFPVRAKDVRNKLGVTLSELPDEDVDIVGVYRKLQRTLTSLDLDSFFSSGGSELTYLMRLLVASAALDILPSLQLRASAQEQVDNTIWQRLSKIDFELLEAQLRAEVDEQTYNLTQDNGTGSLVLALLAQGTDAVTGEDT